MNATSFVFEPAALNSYELAARVGETGSPDGQTEVVIRGDGSVLAWQRGTQEKPSAETRYQLEPQQVEFVMRSATQFNWTDRFPPRPGIPDEPIVYWSIRAPGAKSATMRMWLHDAERGAQTGEVLALMRQVLERATDGRMYL